MFDSISKSSEKQAKLQSYSRTLQNSHKSFLGFRLSNSTSYDAIVQKLVELERFYYFKDDAIISKDALKKLKEEITSLLENCRIYIFNHASPRYTGNGQKRKHVINKLKKLLEFYYEILIKLPSKKTFFYNYIKEIMSLGINNDIICGVNGLLELYEIVSEIGETYVDQRLYSKNRFEKRKCLSQKRIRFHPYILDSRLEEYERLGPNKNRHQLFWRTPCLEDIEQGNIGDCYLLAPLQAIVNKNPDIILNMMKDNGDGTVTVRLYTYCLTSKSYEPRYYRIEKKLHHGFSKHCMWVQMFERAYLIHRKVCPASEAEREASWRSPKILKSDLDGGQEYYVFSAALGKFSGGFICASGVIIRHCDNLMTVSSSKHDDIWWPYEDNHSYAVLDYKKTDFGHFIKIIEPNRGGGGKYKECHGVDYNPETDVKTPCKGQAIMWAKLEDFMTESEIKRFIKTYQSK